jgi:ferredoxin-NADP reductase
MSTAAASPGYLVRLKDRQELADHTAAFRFEKPPGWTFKAGQYIEITVPHLVNDADGSDRVFSIASAPHEETVMVATRMRDTSPKRTLSHLPLGATVKLDGPFGNLTLHNNASRPAVLLAGGIGVTPFRSIAFRAAREKLPHRIYLFHANRRPEDAPFLDELQALERNNPNYRYVATMTQPEKSRRRWEGKTGHFNWAMLSEALKDAVSRSPIYYVAGPPGMVRAMQVTLNGAGVDDDDIRAEEFSGY